MKQPRHLLNQTIPTGLLILLFLFVFAVLPATVGAQIFVDADAGGANDGSSWTNAYNNLQDALTNAGSGDQIWVAEGIYYPDEGTSQTDNDRSATFQLINGIEIYGGFAGTESLLGERDFDANSTILSGDIDGDDLTTAGVVTDTGDIAGDNSYHVVTGSGTDATALLNGFTITAGLADGGSPDYFGGGMYNDTGSPALTNLTFSGNSAGIGGGGMYNNVSHPTLTNVTFTGNSANFGGGMYNNISHPTLTNVTLSGNSADGNGGGMYNFDDASPTLTNSIIWGNTAGSDGNEIFNDISSATLDYSLYRNQSGDIVEGDGFTATNSLTEDPQFADPGSGDYSLQNISPAINAGSNQAYTDAGGDLANDTDLAGNPRLFGGAPDPDIIDIGAYEFQGEPFFIGPDGSNILYVDQNVSDGDGSGNSWANAIPELRDALAWAGDEWDGSDPTLQIWVADGLYLPTDDSNRSATFQLVNNVEIYGGFAGTESLPGDRDFDANPAILSGDIDGDDTAEIISDPDTEINGNNSFHVVTGSGTDATALLNGFTITAGLANDGSSPDNSGGGMYNDTGSPALTNIIFSGNSAGTDGGGMFNFDSSPALTNLTFSGNSANDGGGMSNDNSSPTLTGVTFSGNSAGVQGGGMFNANSSSPTLTNVIIWGNQASGTSEFTGASIYNNDTFKPAISYSLIANSGGSGDNWEGSIGTDGGNNIDADPIFVNAGDPDGADNIFGTPDDGLALQDTSPAINMGDPSTNLSLFPGGPDEPLDLAGNPRVFDGETDVIDIGAYEFQGEPFSIGPDDDNILYVDQNVSGGNQSGDSWANAIPELRDALDWAGEEWDGSGPHLQIWVADGLYLPTGDDTDRSATFQLVSSVEIYGGFDGGESNLGARDWAANPTILSGDIDGDDTAEIISDPDTEINGNNSYHVVTGSGTDGTARLDGFTITAGLADGGSPDYFGGGMYNDTGSPALTNLTFSGNSAGGGGGMFNWDSSSPVLTNVTFTANSASFGGGMSNSNGGSPTLTNVTLSGNSADDYGGGMYNSASSPTLTNVTLSGNSAGSNGGGMFNLDNNSPTLTNVTFSGNSANQGGGIFNKDSSPTLTNTIVWGNTATASGSEIFNNSSTVTFTYSLYGNEAGDIEGGGINTDANTLTVDPVFTDPASGNFTLQNISPAINMGDPSTDLSLFPGGPDEPLDLAGNPRIFDGAADPDIIDMGAYEFQGEPFVPEADDGRVLASNLSGHIFTPADFGQGDNDAFVIIQTLPVNGDLEMDGSAVSADDEIFVGDINDGKLTWMPTAGGHGVNYDSFDFTVKDSGIESDTYTMTIDLGAASVDLIAAEGTSGEGWRFLSNPSDGDSYEDLLGPIWTKGIAGSDSPGALFANVFNLNQGDYQWEEPGNMATTTGPGHPFIVYVYADDDHDGTPDGFPKTLTSGQNWQPLDGSFSYGGLGYDESEENPDSHYLIANPHPVSVDFCEMYDGSTNVAGSIDIWDPSVNGGNGDYETLSCGMDDVFIAPFQGFWVRTTDTNPVLEIPEAAYLESAEEGYFKQKDLTGLANLSGLTLTVQSADGVFTNTARILFSEEGTPGLDDWDAPKLSPAGLASRWLSFYSLNEQDKAYALQTLPTDFDDKVRIPLDMETTEAGQFTLVWSLPESQVFGGSYFLRDNRTGEVIELRQEAEYRFTIEEDQAIQTKQAGATHPMSEIAESGVIALDTHRMSTEAAPRFELLIASAGIDGLTELGDVPEQFSLKQNYPNPFNPTTVISYELPQTEQVRLVVYDMVGRRVATLISGQVAAGRHTVNFDASGLSSGVYLYRLAAGSQIVTRKLTVVK